MNPPWSIDHRGIAYCYTADIYIYIYIYIYIEGRLYTHCLNQLIYRGLAYRIHCLYIYRREINPP